MNKKEFFKGLGLAPPEDKVTEIVVPEDKVEVVAPEKETANSPNLDRKASDTGKELDGLKSEVLELRRNGEDVKEELRRTSNVLADLHGQIKASPAIVQGGQILDTLEELQSRLSKLEEALKAEIEAMKCPNPDCEAIVGWPNLPAEWYRETELRPEDRVSIIPQLFMWRGKRCPVCHYFEEVKEQKEMSPGKQLPEGGEE